MPRFHTFEDLEVFLSTTGPKMAQDTLKSATASREQRSAATGVVAAKITEKWGDGLACLDAVTFAMGQNGLMMLKRLDEIDESQPDDPHQTVRVVWLCSSSTRCSSSKRSAYYLAQAFGQGLPLVGGRSTKPR